MSVRPIIIKKIKKVAGGHHGGAWKVAYADFVTAMMAFFLLMWLLNATTEEQRSGIADYFDPKIPISQTSSGGTNVFNGDSVFAQDKLARNGLGGSGRESAIGRDKNQRHETSVSDENVWSKGQESSEFVGNPKAEFAAQKTDTSKTDIDSDVMTVKEIENNIKNSLAKAGSQALIKQLNFKMTDEGLRIDITDTDKSTMFESGSDVPTEKMKKILGVIGHVLSLLKNKIAITGHTDSSPILNRRNYSNWELSADRANASRRELINTGFLESRIKRVEGRADKEPFVTSKPQDSQNRRVGIVILRDTSLEAMRQENQKNTPKKINKENNKKTTAEKYLQPQDMGKENRDNKNLFVPDPLAFE